MLHVVYLLLVSCCLCPALLAPDVALAAYSGPADLIPLQSALPEPWGVLKLLLLLTFAVHLLLVNILFGSCFMALVNAFRSKGMPDFSLKSETSFIPKVLALAVNFGVAPYLFMQVLYGSFFYPSTLLMSVWWLSIVGFVMLAYYGLYIVSDKSASGLSAGRPMLAVVLIMLAMTAFLLSSNSTLMLRPENWLAWLQKPHGTILNTADPTLLPRYLHILLASVAVGGLTYACRTLWAKDKAFSDHAQTSDNIRAGLAWFRYPTMLQVVVGVWFLLVLPPEVRNLFLGGSKISTTALILAITGMLAAIVLSYRGRIYATCAVTAGVVFLIVAIRDIVRDAMLLPYLDIRDSASEVAQNAITALAIDKGQDLGFAVFLFCTVLAVVIIAWMSRAVYKAVREADTAKAGPAGALEE